jgi:Outer membrane lipoprotein carrier protein LolA-like
MWRFALWLLLPYTFAPGHLSASEISCLPWESWSQDQITPTRMPAELERILRHHKGNGLFAKFAEEKKVSILQQPLRSSGELIFLPHKGLYRKLITPFQQEWLMTMTAVQQRDRQGRIETMALVHLPLAKALVEGFLTVFSGSWEAIHAQFHVYFASDTQQWRLGLTPKHTMLSKIISCMILEGQQEQVQSLTVRETDGDITRDQFIESQILPPEQWGDYQWHFEWGIGSRP